MLTCSSVAYFKQATHRALSVVDSNMIQEDMHFVANMPRTKDSLKVLSVYFALIFHLLEHGFEV